MPLQVSYKAAFLTLWAVFAIILPAGCGSGGNQQKSSFRTAKITTPALEGDGGARDGLDPGNVENIDWDDDFSDLANRRNARGAGPEQADARTARSVFWTIILRTYGQDTDGLMARNTLDELKRRVPELSRAEVRVTSKGSMLIFGRYDGPEDQSAQQDLARIKAIKINNREVFRGAMLSRLRNPLAASHPNHLMSVRRQYPKVDPLYTLDVAVWSDFDSGRLTLEQIQNSAEQYAAQLRAQNLPAYFYHDEDMRLSIVTVGLFDHTAIDPEAGLESPELTLLRKRFPARLMNGEEVLELINPRLSDERRVQAPRLVLVPMP